MGKGHWFGELSGQDYGLIECEFCYLIVEARRLKEFAGEKCPDDKPSRLSRRPRRRG